MPLPNGLEFLPDGSAVTSRDIKGEDTGITRVDPADPSHPQYNWARIADSNGLIVDPTGTWLYTVETFTRLRCMQTRPHAVTSTSRSCNG